MMLMELAFGCWQSDTLLDIRLILSLASSGKGTSTRCLEVEVDGEGAM